MSCIDGINCLDVSKLFRTEQRREETFAVGLKSKKIENLFVFIIPVFETRRARQEARHHSARCSHF